MVEFAKGKEKNCGLVGEDQFVAEKTEGSWKIERKGNAKRASQSSVSQPLSSFQEERNANDGMKVTGESHNCRIRLGQKLDIALSASTLTFCLSASMFF